jgi:ribosomal protein S18 acetylase RimI-like enzyme
MLQNSPPAMSSYVLELLDASHDRVGFSSGLDSVNRYLRETARGHLEKGVSVTRVLVETNAVSPKAVLGYFTLSSITVDAREWPGTPKGMPRQAVPAVLLGRLAVAQNAHGSGIGSMLVATARQLARETIVRIGGIGLVVDASNEEIVGFYARYGFQRVAPDGLRMFLPAASLEGGMGIPLQ